MPWLDLDQPQSESPFTPMGWLGGAQSVPEDPSVVLARRMRQQSPNVPTAHIGGIGSDFNAGNGEMARARGIGSDYAGSMPGQKLRDLWPMLSRTVTGAPDGGVGSDYAAYKPDMPNPPPAYGAPLQNDYRAGAPNGVGSDYAASGGIGTPPLPRPSIPTSPGDMEDVFPPPSVTADGPAAPGIPAAGNVPIPQSGPPGPADGGGQLPPNARPAIGGPAQPQAQPAPSLLDRIGNGLNNNSELLLSLGAGFAGAPSFGAGMQRAFSNARPLMGRNQTVDALVKRGMPEEMARAAVSNPEVLKQVLPQFFGAKQRKFTQVGEDMMGNKQFGFVDEVSNKVYDLAGKEIGQSQQGGPDIPVGPDGQHLQGEELRAHIAKTNPVVAAALKDMFEGKQNPNARNLQKLAPLASLVYPGFDASDYPNRLKLRNSYTSGKDHQELEAINTVSGHMGKLMDSADKLGNTGFKPWNYLKNMAADKTFGSPELVKFRNDLVTTQNELAKAYHGGHVSDSAFNAFNKSINEMQTPDELKAAIGELAGLLHSKIGTKENSYRVGMQHAPLPQEYSAMSDEAKTAFSKIHDWSVGNKPLGAAAPATGQGQSAPAAPAPGKYVYDPKTGQMVRSQ